ncbi:DUF1385 domain-containing protein [Desulfovibrio sp.]|uniref:DUF1385 domain-containing protein n=1 Tax=Desulfovibrio sp. TaxID=885 RepID=UPI0023D1609D|nr:DUF1385 domain-containing protein [Desulfovibrio sp.]MDE7240427.1 DUF1385 domain-containing protein [Desulfovibrio sp.]
MEGVMMRNGDVYGLAVRQPGGGILARRLPWFTLTRRPWLRMPFVRGFPILLETLVNGIRALNRSVEMADGGQGDAAPLSPWQVCLSLGLALLMAVGLFVVAPHLLSLIMLWLNLGGDVEGLTFHLWDGFFKCCIFVAYIWLISLVPEIRRVFQYHGAEHKTIHAFESGGPVAADRACDMSRLHPRCGTTFLLFVICISIILQALLVPLLLAVWTPESAFAKHALSVGFKLLLVIPISALAYELIRYAARLPEGPRAKILRAPGLALQRLTAHEPDERQMEVAVVALAEALGRDADTEIRTPHYSRL